MMMKCESLNGLHVDCLMNQSVVIITLRTHELNFKFERMMVMLCEQEQSHYFTKQKFGRAFVLGGLVCEQRLCSAYATDKTCNLEVDLYMCE
jgi:hypothetical protein